MVVAKSREFMACSSSVVSQKHMRICPDENLSVARSRVDTAL